MNGLQIERFPGASEQRLFRYALYPRPSASEGEDTAARQIHDALCFAGQHDQVAICLDDHDNLEGAVCWTPSAGGATLVRYLGSKRKGVGTVLLRLVAADAVSRDEGLHLESIPSASGFYAKLGFQRSGQSELGYPLYALAAAATAELAR